MSRTAITVQNFKDLRILPFGSGTAAATMTAADASNNNLAPFPGNGALILVAQNTHASTPYTITVTSAADEFGRTGDITTYSLAAGDIVPLLIPANGWKQSDGNLYFQASNASVKFAIYNAQQ